jgi:uncharacterized membrane protein
MGQFHTLRRLIRSHPRLSIAIAAGSMAAIALPAEWHPLTRALIGCNLTVWSYLLLMGWLMTHASHARIRTIADQEDEKAAAVLAIMSLAAVASVAAIVMEISTTKNVSFGGRLLHYCFTGATLLGSWLLLGVMFTFHYAHSFYRAPRDRQPLRFPEGAQEPDYWDFLYFSFTIAVAAQTSDIIILTRPMRKTVLAQSVLSFLFNAAILGLSINVTAGLLGT